MRIKTLTIHNFRIFGEGHPPFVFADRMTVIAGVNGRGKTAILDAIRILTSRLLPLISDAKGGYTNPKRIAVVEGKIRKPGTTEPDEPADAEGDE